MDSEASLEAFAGEDIEFDLGLAKATAEKLQEHGITAPIGREKGKEIEGSKQRKWPAFGQPVPTHHQRGGGSRGGKRGRGKAGDGPKHDYPSGSGGRAGRLSSFLEQTEGIQPGLIPEDDPVNQRDIDALSATSTRLEEMVEIQKSLIDAQNEKIKKLEEIIDTVQKDNCLLFNGLSHLKKVVSSLQVHDRLLSSQPPGAGLLGSPPLSGISLKGVADKQGETEPSKRDTVRAPSAPQQGSADPLVAVRNKRGPKQF
jgi:hypothetical protein